VTLNNVLNPVAVIHVVDVKILLMVVTAVRGRLWRIFYSTSLVSTLIDRFNAYLTPLWPSSAS